MGSGLGIFVLIAAMALCTIVGIYYCWVRKIDKKDQAAEASPPGTSR